MGDLHPHLADLAIALGLGLIVGLERQHSDNRLAGVRTFTLITVLGFAAGLLGTAVLASFIVALALLIAVGAYQSADPGDVGLTTEVAMLLMFGVGALLALEQRHVALAMGAGAAVLLEFKGTLHGIAARLDHEDLRAIMKFVLLSLVILPLVPNRTFGPYQVLNPRQIWWMVVLVVGIDLAGYLTAKLFPGASVFWQGLLGGLVSSTATTAAYARRVAGGSCRPAMAAMVAALASGVVFFRIAAALAAVSPALLMATWLPLALAVVAAAAAIAWFHFRGSSQGDAPAVDPSPNPTELSGAFWFAGFYSLILLGSAAAHTHLGDQWLSLVSIIGGLTDVDAVTLSAANLVNTGKLGADPARSMILIAILSNTAFKLAMAAWLGGRALARSLGQILLPVFVVLAVCLLLGGRVFGNG